MIPNEGRKIAQAWCDMHRADEDSQAYLNNFWAYEELEMLVVADPCKSLDIVDEVLLIDDSDIIIANLAAGPVEGVLMEHGDEVISTIIEKARSNILWKQLINSIWKNDIKEHVWEQLQQAKSSVESRTKS